MDAGSIGNRQKGVLDSYVRTIFLGKGIMSMTTYTGKCPAGLIPAPAILNEQSASEAYWKAPVLYGTIGFDSRTGLECGGV